MADNDSSIMFTIIGIFIFLGVLMPYVNSAFGQTAIQNNVNGLSSLGQDLEPNEVGILEVLASIILMFFWTFGGIPIIIDLLIMLPLRIFLGILIYRNIRGI